MDWLHPEYFWAFALIPLAVALFFWAARRRAVLLRRFGDAAVMRRLAGEVSQRRRRWKAAVAVLALGFITLGLVGPRFGTQIREVKREGVDLIIALDVSLSMQAEDVAPSRLDRSKNEIKKLLDGLRGDRVGLVLFAGDAFLQCPLTTDYSAVKLFLDVANPALIPTPGTDFGAALRLSMQAFERSEESGSEGETRTRALVFISDGENHIDGVNALVDDARAAGIVMFAAGVGETEGAPIPVGRSRGQTTYKKDRQGRIVSTRLEEDMLQRLSEEGAYFRIARTASSLNKLISSLDRLEKSEFATEEFEEYDEKYQWPLAIGVLLLLFEFVFSDRVKSSEGRAPSNDLLPGLVVLALLATGCSNVTQSGRKGNAEYADDRFDEAVIAYQRGLDEFDELEPGSVPSDLYNNQGAAYYRGENPEASQNAFINSIAMAEGRDQQIRGSYNAGNAAFANDAKSVSADFFRQALLLDPQNADAKFNYEFVKRQLKREQQNQQGENEPPPKPSDYAKQLKARADALVAEQRYRDAHEIMTDGLKTDPTVKAYQTFIDRTASVADIETGKAPESL